MWTGWQETKGTRDNQATTAPTTGMAVKKVSCISKKAGDIVKTSRPFTFFWGGIGFPYYFPNQTPRPPVIPSRNQTITLLASSVTPQRTYCTPSAPLSSPPRSLSDLGNRSENSAGRGQILSILRVNSRSIDQESGEIWTVQTDLQQIYPKSDRLLGLLWRSLLAEEVGEG